jgi:hypothetical protein
MEKYMKGQGGLSSIKAAKDVLKQNGPGRHLKAPGTGNIVFKTFK